MSYDNPPPPPPPPGYGAVPPAYGGGAPRESGKATASMVTGLVGLLTICCGIFAASSIAALILGFMARSEIAQSNGQITGGQRATIGIVTGSVGLGLLALSIILVATGVVDTNFDFEK